MRPSTCSTCRPIEPGYVDRGLLALHDFAAGMSLPPDEIEKERGVVIEEWRGRLGAGSRLTDKQLPVLLAKSRYAERLPIGTPEILKSFPRQRLLDFYRKWYRPDQMAVVVVGDIDPAEAQKLVEQRFGVIPAAKAPLEAVDRTRAAAQGDAVHDRDRSGGAGLVGRARAQAAVSRSSGRWATIGAR